VNMMLIQYFVNYNFPEFYLTMAPIITANWKAKSGQQWTVPFGLGIGKIFKIAGKLPLNVSVQGYYNAIKPEATGAEWTLRLQAQFMLPLTSKKKLKGE